ncbi:hypothetical protein LLH06_12805 [Mucilaginibacter daejeonensis]|uniref:hypothetical protein n=1 Tax=Mucilaginibacter daejeonensis TaxID=398049 RepID=UPI001D178EC1|nr:hypothetical protein [Mucilaginibacter daejeonensis]UEG51843.1 hypothetical protein LLH06_12805 [Mucilaginibacter daejeonensis]
MAKENVAVKEKKVVLEPQISLTMISRYIIASERRRKSILKGCKYPPNYIPRFYEVARKLVCEAFSLNFIDQHEVYFDDFKRHAARLRKEAKDYAENTDDYKNRIYSAKGLDSIVAMEQLLTPILQKYVLENNLTRRRNKIMQNGVRIGAMADLILSDDSSTPVGFLKFNFSTTKLKKEEAAAKLWVLHRFYSERELNFNHKICLVIDVAAWRIYRFSDVQNPGKEIDLASHEIFNIWKLI